MLSGQLFLTASIYYTIHFWRKYLFWSNAFINPESVFFLLSYISVRNTNSFIPFNVQNFTRYCKLKNILNKQMEIKILNHQTFFHTILSYSNGRWYVFCPLVFIYYGIFYTLYNYKYNIFLHKGWNLSLSIQHAEKN